MNSDATYRYSATLSLVFLFICNLALGIQLKAQTYQLLKDVNPGMEDGLSPQAAVAIKDDLLYFNGDDGIHGIELWVTDATPEGTRMLVDLVPGPGSSNPRNMFLLGDQIFFTMADTIYGNELWITDGTAEGTRLLKDINPGPANAFPNIYIEFQGKVYFTANDGTHGAELWVSDGTETGTYMLKDIRGGAGGSSPLEYYVMGDRFFIRANNGPLGAELWVSDGTEEGTYMVKDIRPGVNGSSPSGFHAYNGKVLFSARGDDSGIDLWISDGTEEGTQLLKGGMYFPRFFTSYNGKVLFATDTESLGSELWITDGTTDGTTVLKDIHPGPANSNPAAFQLYNGKVFFSATGSEEIGQELWVTDGTTAGTQLVKDLTPGEGDSYPNGFTISENRLYFFTTTYNDDHKIWSSNGTPSGTHFWSEDQLTLLLNYQGTPNRRAIFPVGNKLVYGAVDPVYGKELFVINNSNNSCQFGTELKPGWDCNLLTFDNSNTTPSEGLSPVSCGGATAYRDAWFDVRVPTNGELHLNAAQLPDGLEEWLVAIYSGTCDNLTPVDCRQISDLDPSSAISLENRSPGETLHIRVLNEVSQPEGDFGLCVQLPVFCGPEQEIFEGMIGSGTYAAQQSITASGVITEGQVRFLASNSIALQDGFTVGPASQFQARIQVSDACDFGAARVTSNFDTPKFSNDNSLKIYPNPASDELNIEVNLVDSDPYAQFQLYDLNGRPVTELFTFDVEDSRFSISTINLPGGSYIAVVKTSSDTVVGKVTILR